MLRYSSLSLTDLLNSPVEDVVEYKAEIERCIWVERSFAITAACSPNMEKKDFKKLCRDVQAMTAARQDQMRDDDEMTRIRKHMETMEQQEFFMEKRDGSA